MPQQKQTTKYMKKFINPSNISIDIEAPASKSYAQRALIASLLAGGNSLLTGFTLCDDTLAAIEVIRPLGANVSIEGRTCVVKSSFDRERYTPSVIECGESGLLSRMTIAVMALYDRHTVVTGRGTLMNRSFVSMERPMRELGTEILFDDGKLPAEIKWGMKGGQTTIDGSSGSQLLTALLMTLPLTPRGGDLFVVDLVSKPYIDMTINLMEKFGVEVVCENYERFIIRGNSRYTATTYNIEGDWSSAATLLIAGVLAGEVTVHNIDIKSLQADRRILDCLLDAGVDMVIGYESVTTRRSVIGKFCFDATHCPDLIPSLVALATKADGDCVIKGVNRLSNKESHRAQVLRDEYAKIGITILLDGDNMIVTPGEIVGGEVLSHGDHRIAMSLALAGLVSRNGVIINEAESVEKSFPEFWDSLNVI